MTIQEYDVVRLLGAIPEHQLPAGAIGTVVMVYEEPHTYEVEFCDVGGITIALVTLNEADLERVSGPTAIGAPQT